MEIKYYTKDEVSLHNSESDCWLIIKNKVYNITDYLEKHRGGKRLLLHCGGKDATKEFYDMNHTKNAKNILDNYYIGHIKYNKEEIKNNEEEIKNNKEEIKSCILGCIIQ